MMKILKSENILISLIIISNFLIRAFRLNSPPFAYLDEKNFFVPAAKSLLGTGEESPYTIISFGKIILAASIKLFGDNPWGWRLPSVVFGTIAALIIYYFAKKLFNNSTIGLIAAVLFSFETAWFANSRIAMVELFFATFVILAFYLLWLFLNNPKTSTFIASSIAFGFAFATKWSAAFPILLAITFIAFSSKFTISKKIISLLAFFAICVVVYLLSLLPYISRDGIGQLVLKHKQLWNFHTVWLDKNFEKTAPYIPKFEYVKDVLQNPLLWLVNKPLPYLEEPKNGNIREILFIFNPLIFYPGILFLLVSLFRSFKELNLRFFFMPAIFLSSYLPWFFAPRFSVPYYLLFGICALIINLAYFIDQARKKASYIAYLYLGLVILAFIIFYPVISSMEVPKNYLAVLTSIWRFPIP